MPKTKSSGKSSVYEEHERKRRRLVSSYMPLTIESASSVGMQKSGAYAATLIDPFNHRGIRIPDLACFPTATHSSEYSFLWAPSFATATASNTNALVIDLGPVGGGYAQFVQGVGSTAPGVVGARNTTSQKPGGGGVGAATLTASFDTRFSSARVVSAGVLVQFCGGDADSKGTISVVTVPASGVDQLVGQAWVNGTTDPGVNVSSPLLRRVFYTGPLVDGCYATYRPMDGSSFNMVNGAASNNSFGAFVVSLEGTAVTGGGLCPEMFVKVIVNYECITADNTYGQENLSVVVDGAATEGALNAGARIPPVGSAGKHKSDSKKANHLLKVGGLIDK